MSLPVLNKLSSFPEFIWLENPYLQQLNIPAVKNQAGHSNLGNLWNYFFPNLMFWNNFRIKATKMCEVFHIPLTQNLQMLTFITVALFSSPLYGVQLWCWRRLLSVPWTARQSEIQPVHPKWNQSWIVIGRTDAEAGALILWPPDVKNRLIGKDPDTGKDWRWEEKGTTEDEKFGWHHWLDGHEFE